MGIGVALASPAFAWVFDGHDAPVSVGSDAVGDVLVVERIRSRKLSRADGSIIWANEESGAEEASQAAFTPAGDVVTASLGDVHWAAADGSTRWLYQRPMGSTDDVKVVVIDTAGDVVGAGLNSPDLVVLKLDGATGAPLWRTQLDGDGNPIDLFDRARDLAIDAAGDVLVVGTFSASQREMAVVKLDGGTGDELWRLGARAGEAKGVAVDPSGDFYVAAGGQSGTFTVLKLDGATGAVVWENVVPEEDTEATDVVLAGGALFVKAWLDRASVVLRLDPATGAEAWRHAPGSNFAANGFAVAGDVVALGGSVLSGSRRLGVVSTLDAATGAERWRRAFSPLGGDGDAGVVAIDADGGIAFTMTYETPQATPGDAGVVRVRATDGVSTFGRPCGPLVCRACDTCAAPGVCVARPLNQNECTPPFSVQRSSAQLRNGTTPVKDQLVWRWTYDSFLPVQMGTPKLDTDYALCAYHQVAGSPSVVMQYDLTSFLHCGKRPCWTIGGSAVSPTFNFKEAAKGPLGKTTFTTKLRAGPKTQISLKGKGPGLGMPALGLTPPVRVELRTSQGFCWGAEYTANQVLTSTPSEFKAQGGH